MLKYIKNIIIGILIACVLLDMIIYPVLHILIDKFIGDYIPPAVFYSVWIYSSIFLSGVYIGTLEEKKWWLIAVVVGLLYLPVKDMIALLIGSSKQFNYLGVGYIYGLLKFSIVCISGSIASQLILTWIKKTGSSPK